MHSSIVDHEGEATVTMSMVQFAATTVKETTATVANATADICPVVKTSSHAIDRNSNKVRGDPTFKFGPICRLCKTSLIF